MLRVALLCAFLGCALAACPPNSTKSTQRPKCFTFFKEPMDFSGAETYCEKFRRNGRLVAMIDKVEAQLVLDTVKSKTTSSKFWIGIAHNFVSGKKGHENIWLDLATPYNYTRWKKGVRSDENKCVVAQTSDGRWTTADCEKKLPFLCITDY